MNHSVITSQPTNSKWVNHLNGILHFHALYAAVLEMVPIALARYTADFMSWQSLDG